MWEDKGRELDNWWMKSWLEKRTIEIYSTHSEGKPVIAERFMRILKKNYKSTTSVSKNVYIDKLDDMVNKCNNTYHSTTLIKPVDVKSNIYILILVKKITKKILNLKLVILLENKNIKIFLQTVMFQIGLKKFL